MTRPLTDEELGYLRREGQSARVYAAIHTPAVVFRARIAQDFDSIDGVTEIAYDRAEGSLSDVLPGMTLYIGTSPDAYDRGMCRIRKTPTTSKLYIGETSEIYFEQDLYLAVVDEFGLWPKHVRVSESGQVWMDYDIEYTDQHTNCAPVPVLDHAAAWQDAVSPDAPVSVTFDASRSWVLRSTITSYAWSFPGAASVIGADTATPVAMYNAPGAYRAECTITAANGAQTTGYRYVFVYDNTTLPEPITLVSCRGDWLSGGWSAKLRMWSGAAGIRDRALVILWTIDTVTTETGQPLIKSIGPLDGREPVLMIGYLDGESIRYDAAAGTVEFELHGPHWMLNKMLGYPTGVENVRAAPSAWTQMQNLTVDAGLWHMLYWRTTACQVMNVILSGDARQVGALEAPLNTLWQQITTMAEETILAHPCCDRYGRLYIEINTQYLADSDKASLPTVVDLESGDWCNEINLQRVVPSVGQLIVTGVAYTHDKSTPYGAIAPGNAPKRYGRAERYDRLALSSQAQAIQLCGRMLGALNNPYPYIEIQLTGSNRFVDIAPRQWVTMSIAASDTPRGITWDKKRLIVRNITLQHTKGVLQVMWECEADTKPEPAAVWEIPSWPNPSGDHVPPYPPDWPQGDVLGVVVVDRYGIWVTDNIHAVEPVWYPAFVHTAGLVSAAAFAPASPYKVYMSLNGIGCADWCHPDILYCHNIFDFGRGTGAWRYMSPVSTTLEERDGITQDWVRENCTCEMLNGVLAVDTNERMLYTAQLGRGIETCACYLIHLRHRGPGDVNTNSPLLAYLAPLGSYDYIGSISYGISAPGENGHAIIGCDYTYTSGEPPMQVHEPTLWLTTDNGNTLAIRQTLPLYPSETQPWRHYPFVARAGHSNNMLVWRNWLGAAASVWYSDNECDTITPCIPDPPPDPLPPVPNPLPNAYAVAMSPVDGTCIALDDYDWMLVPETGYRLLTSRKMYYSSDYGRTWTEGAPLPSEYRMACVSVGRYAGGQLWAAGGTKLIVSYDNGRTWLDKTGNLPCKTIRQVLVIESRP